MRDITKEELERMVFEKFLAVKPEFAGEKLQEWVPVRCDPPDFACVTKSGSEVGVELTAWLAEEQISESKLREAIERSFLNAIGTQLPNRSQNFSHVWLHPQDKPRIKPADRVPFRNELFTLLGEVDSKWQSQPLWQSPQGCSYPDPALETYPMLERYLTGLRFFPGDGSRAWPAGKDWLTFPSPAGAYSAEPMRSALLEVLRKKIEKYAQRPTGASQFVVLIHYTQALLHNTPPERLDFRFEDAARDASKFIGDDPGVFHMIYLFLTHKGVEFQLFP